MPAYRNCCLIIIDCLRADRLSPWGGEIPFLDGRLFTRCISANGWTLLSIASILTGKYPSEHGLLDHSCRIRVPGAAAAFREAGFFTAAIVNNNNLQPEFGFPDGFERYENFPNEDHDSPFRRFQDAVAQASAGPFLLVFHTNIVHDYFLGKPYYRDRAGAEPVPPAGRKPWIAWPKEYHDILRARYDRGIRHCIARIRSEILPLLDLERTLVMVTSDHGEGIYSPRVYHAGRLHNDLLQVPTVILNEQGEDSRLFSQTELWNLIRPRLGLPLETAASSGAARAEDFAYIYRHDLPEGQNRIDYKTSPGLSLQCWYDEHFKTIVARSPVDAYSHVERYDIAADWAETNNLAWGGSAVEQPSRFELFPVGGEKIRQHAEAILAAAQFQMELGAWHDADDLLAPVRELFLPYLGEHAAAVWLRTGMCREALGDFLGAIAAFDCAAGFESLAGSERLSLDYHVAVCNASLGRAAVARARLSDLMPKLARWDGPAAADLRKSARAVLDAIAHDNPPPGDMRQWSIEAPERSAAMPEAIGSAGALPAARATPVSGVNSVGSDNPWLPTSAWAAEMAELELEDAGLPGGLNKLNLTLNRLRLAQFLDEFAADCDVRDFLLLDSLGLAIEARMSSTGLVEDASALPLRPFRLWEYVWLFKALGLAKGRFDVLDLGGPASHVVLLGAIAGNRVTSLDTNPVIVEAGRVCAQALALSALAPQAGDMRDLSRFSDASFDRIICCSVLEHLRAEDQKKALAEMARVLRPGGIIGLTFDYGTPAPGANMYLPPPHEPPRDAQEIRERYLQGGLRVLGNTELEDPVPGSLFRNTTVKYVMGSLFVGRPPVRHVPAPRPAVRRDSVVGAHSIADFPYRCFRRAQDMQHQTYAANEAARRIEELERIAAERREALAAANRESQRLREEAERRAETIRDLERVAAERLEALEAASREAELLRVEAERRLETIREVERVAAERLDLLVATDRAAAEIRAEAERREAALRELTEAIRERERRIEELQGAMERLEGAS